MVPRIRALSRPSGLIGGVAQYLRLVISPSNGIEEPLGVGVLLVAVHCGVGKDVIKRCRQLLVGHSSQ